MTISSIGSNSYYMGQMSGMGGRSPGRMSKSAGEAPPTPEEMFDKLDADGSGGLDQTEFQTLADKVSQSSETDSESLFAAYDADEDGILSQEETLTFMEENRPSGPPPGGMAGGMGGMGGPPPDASEIFSELDEDEDGSLSETEFQTLAEKISEATGEEVDAEELFAAYDTDGDGVLSEEEATAAIEENRPEGSQPGGMGGTGGPPPDASEMFSELDEDGDGSLSETEFQTLAEKISEATGEEVVAEELFAAYDTDGDGVLSEEEATNAIEENRPEGPPPPPSGGMMSQSGNVQQRMQPGIESYMQMDAMGMGRNQSGNMSTMFGGNSGMSSFGMQFPFNIMA